MTDDLMGEVFYRARFFIDIDPARAEYEALKAELARLQTELENANGMLDAYAEDDNQ